MTNATTYNSGMDKLDTEIELLSAHDFTKASDDAIFDRILRVTKYIEQLNFLKDRMTNYMESLRKPDRLKEDAETKLEELGFNTKTRVAGNISDIGYMPLLAFNQFLDMHIIAEKEGRFNQEQKLSLELGIKVLLRSSRYIKYYQPNKAGNAQEKALAAIAQCVVSDDIIFAIEKIISDKDHEWLHIEEKELQAYLSPTAFCKNFIYM